jgi:hypothetical protein
VLSQCILSSPRTFFVESLAAYRLFVLRHRSVLSQCVSSELFRAISVSRAAFTVSSISSVPPFCVAPPLCSRSVFIHPSIHPSIQPSTLCNPTNPYALFSVPCRCLVRPLCCDSLSVCCGRYEPCTLSLVMRHVLCHGSVYLSFVSRFSSVPSLRSRASVFVDFPPYFRCALRHRCAFRRAAS